MRIGIRRSGGGLAPPAGAGSPGSRATASSSRSPTRPELVAVLVVVAPEPARAEAEDHAAAADVVDGPGDVGEQLRVAVADARDQRAELDAAWSRPPTRRGGSSTRSARRRVRRTGGRSGPTCRATSKPSSSVATAAARSSRQAPCCGWSWAAMRIGCTRSSGPGLTAAPLLRCRTRRINAPAARPGSPRCRPAEPTPSTSSATCADRPVRVDDPVGRHRRRRPAGEVATPRPRGRRRARRSGRRASRALDHRPAARRGAPRRAASRAPARMPIQLAPRSRTVPASTNDRTPTSR